MSSLIQNIRNRFGNEVLGLLFILILVVLIFSSTNSQFLTLANFNSMSFQLPVLGLLTLAMLAPLLSAGLNLAIIYQANLCGLTLAWVLNMDGGIDASITTFLIGVAASIMVGALTGLVMGVVISYVGAHPILVSLAMMIFLRGLGVFLTSGGDISGFPEYMEPIGHGFLMGIPIPLIIFLLVAYIWNIVLNSTRHGFSIYMLGSNIEATDFAGVHTKRTLTLIYVFSGVICAVAGILMLTRFNSVRVGHGEALLLVTVLACFLGGVDPFGGFGRVVPVVISLIILQMIASGLNLFGASQHLSTAVWGLSLILVMMVRFIIIKYKFFSSDKGG